MANEDTFHLGIKALIQDNDKKLLLLKVNVAELKKYSGEPYWDIPGGRMQLGDTIESALLREIKEETGITAIKSYDIFLGVLSNIRIPVGEKTVGLILHTYLCSVDQISEIQLSNEHIEYGWFYPKEAASLLEVKYPLEFTKKLKEL